MSRILSEPPLSFHGKERFIVKSNMKPGAIMSRYWKLIERHVFELY